ncbi:DNA adenine methylase [Paenibacillus oralis]|uniref:DNA adenine methylase n=1 Tax=Paenibacillus oralis TaxID=2490856 RepID=A0A3P3T9G8_9BACL|nr:DNA adenine methylase [Paenibacillus oralis]RRJ54695.1 DNA adenine methylase [Paenibacillus oralis]
MNQLSNKKSTLRYFGGKGWLAKHLISLFPEDHTYSTFVDLFGGGGHVITQKARTSQVEVFNDKDADLVNFLLVLAGPQRQELKRKLHSLPTSRYLFEKWQDEWFQGIRPDSELERAIRYYYIQRMKIVPSPNEKSGFRSSKTKNTATDFQHSIENLDDFAERFRNVMIEQRDFRDIIEIYDSPNTFFFCDAPYVNRERRYKGGFSKGDHIDLANLLSKIQGKAMVTYYGHPLILELYSSWRLETVDAAVGGVTKGELGESRNRKTEHIFMNYQYERQMTLWD